MVMSQYLFEVETVVMVPMRSIKMVMRITPETMNKRRRPNRDVERSLHADTQHVMGMQRERGTKTEHVVYLTKPTMGDARRVTKAPPATVRPRVSPLV